MIINIYTLYTNTKLSSQIWIYYVYFISQVNKDLYQLLTYLYKVLDIEIILKLGLRIEKFGKVSILATITNVEVIEVNTSFLSIY